MTLDVGRRMPGIMEPSLARRGLSDGAAGNDVVDAVGGRELRRVGRSAESLADRVGGEGAAVRSMVEDGAVADAAAGALAAVAAQLTVCAGGLEHAAAAVTGSADAYDEVDSSAAARLSGVGSAG